MLDRTLGHRADNDDWYDDTSDGPVAATIELDDGTTAESTAWGIVALIWASIDDHRR